MRNSRHTREFKESAIQLVLNSHEEIKNIAQDLGMNAKTLYNWVYNYKRDNNLQTCNRKSSKSKVKESTEEELRRLHRDNRILKQERDILTGNQERVDEVNGIWGIYQENHIKV